MNLSLIICLITGLLVFLSVLFKPHIYIGRRKRVIGLYWVISLIGALALIITRCIPLDYLFTELTAQSSVNPLKILVLFFSMTYLSIFLDEIGFFRYLANLALSKTGSSQTKLFVVLYAVVSVLTVFTSNDIVVLTFTPFICFFAKNARVNPMPYLFAEFVASNTWSMLLIIGNPTNIYLASSAGIDFISYVTTMALPTLFGGITSFVILYLVFRKDLKKEMQAEATPIAIEDKSSLFLGIAHLGICTILLAISSYLDFEMYLISAGFAVSLLVLSCIVRLSRRKTLKPIKTSIGRLPYELVPFVLSMFVLVLSLNYSGTTEIIAGLLSNGEPVWTMGISSFVMSNIINNIPMSVLFSSIIETIGDSSPNFLPSVYASVVGSNIGAFFTSVGALAGIMWSTILRRFGVEFSFKKFVLYGIILSFPTLFATLLGLFILF